MTLFLEENRKKKFTCVLQDIWNEFLYQQKHLRIFFMQSNVQLAITAFMLW